MQQSNKLERGRITILCCRRVLFHLQVNVPLAVIKLDVRSQGVQNKRVLHMYIATEQIKHIVVKYRSPAILGAREL